MKANSRIIQIIFRNFFFATKIILLANVIFSQNYTLTKASRDGIGKVYLGREISGIMGHLGANWLERNSREIEERPDLVVKAMNLAKNHVVVDFGAGSGYFTKRIAPLCSLVYAVDIQREMLELNKVNMVKDGVYNSVPMLGESKKTNLPDLSIDFLIMIDVYHELEFPYEIMKDVYRAMKKEGKVILVEYRKEDPAIRIKPLHKMSVVQIKKEMIKSGFILSRSYGELPKQHMLFFEKKQYN